MLSCQVASCALSSISFFLFSMQIAFAYYIRTWWKNECTHISNIFTWLQWPTDKVHRWDDESQISIREQVETRQSGLHQVSITCCNGDRSKITFAKLINTFHYCNLRDRMGPQKQNLKWFNQHSGLWFSEYQWIVLGWNTRKMFQATSCDYWAASWRSLIGRNWEKNSTKSSKWPKQ